MKVIVTQRAKHNLLDIFDYNVNISLNYAIRIDKKIRSYIEDLHHSPYIIYWQICLRNIRQTLQRTNL